ncbi:MAG: M48 family metalloprotease [Myxococcota bacterium]
MRRVYPLVGALCLAGCSEGLPDVNIFSIEDDMQLGADLADEIASHPKQYGEILDPVEYAQAYDYLNGIRDELLDTGEVSYANRFDWETHILHDDEVLNAFAAPGGYIYVYTGLIKFLDQEDHFAGVLGHEIAHAANRHSTEQLTQAYGIETLISIVLGDGTAGQVAEIASGLATLSFSREDEAEADEYSVYYLCETLYAADGTAGFFEKLQADGGIDIPEFLSTHPSDENRIADIEALAAELGCSLEPNPDARWQAFVNTLP